MSELREIVPRPARVAKHGRCAEGPSVKTMLWDAVKCHNGRFLRHRPKRSERCLNNVNCTKASKRCQRAKVCRRPQRKNHVVRPAGYRLRPRDLEPQIASAPNAIDSKKRTPAITSGRIGRGGTYVAALSVKEKMKHRKAASAKVDGVRCQSRSVLGCVSVPSATAALFGDS